MVGDNDRILFTINKDLQYSKMNNDILSQQWPTNVVVIAQPTLRTATHLKFFYSYSRWMKDKGKHVIY